MRRHFIFTLLISSVLSSCILKTKKNEAKVPTWTIDFLDDFDFSIPTIGRINYFG